MSTKRIVVIGGVAAGMSAASAARRLKPDYEVVTLEKGEFVSYAACGIPYYLGQVVKDHTSLVAVTPEEFREKRNIDLRTMHEATKIDPGSKTVEVKDVKSGETYTLEWEKLIIATGARAIRLPFEEEGFENVFPVHTLQEGVRVMSFLRDRNPRRAVIVGAGYVGLELAEAFRSRGMVVSVVQSSDRVMRRMEPEIDEKIVAELERNGVVLQKETKVKDFEKGPNGGVKRVVTDKGGIETDLVVVSIGIRPNVEMATDAGIETGETGAIATDEYMRTNNPDVYAAGDCAQTHHRILNRPTYIPLGDTANKHGRVAGTHAAGGDMKFPGVVGSSVAKVFELGVARTGLGLDEALAEGYDAVSNTVTAQSKAHYYPGKKPITITLIFDASTARILGGQLVGADDVAKRCDVLATAITNGMTMSEFEFLDLCYAPPYSPVYDPLLVAARQAMKKVK